MRIHRFTLLFIPLTLLFIAPALAEDVVPTAPVPASAETDTVEATVPAETVTVGATDSTDTSASVLKADLDVPGLENAVQKMLGVTSPLTTETSLSYGSGYCAHDCTECETREHCDGWPCTQVPIC